MNIKTNLIKFEELIKNTLLSYPKISVILGGVCLTLGYAPYFLWALAICALTVSLFIVSNAKNSKNALFLAFLFGFFHNLTLYYWLAFSFYNKDGSLIYGIVVGVPYTIAFTLVLTLFTSIPFYIYYKSLNNSFFKNKAVSVLIFILTWLLIEFTKGHLFLFPWNWIGYIFADNLHILQMSFYFKIYGLSLFALILTGLLLNYKKNWGIIITMLAIAFGLGSFRLSDKSRAEDALKNRGELNILMVQPYIDQANKFGTSFDSIRKIYKITEDSPDKDKADIILWPETAVTTVFNDLWAKRLSSVLSDGQILITGTIEYEDGKYYNSIVAIDSNGNLLANYKKNLLVPFGEFLPFEKYIPNFIKNKLPLQSFYDSGVSGAMVPIKWAKKTKGSFNNLNMIFAICYEVAFSDYMYDKSRNPGLILTVANDGWFNYSNEVYQHLAMARVRAVENDLYMVRLNNLNVSAVFNNRGEMEHILKMRQSQALLVKVPYN